MMDKLIRPTPPAYKGCPEPPKTSGGLLSQLLCYLFGGGTPTYKGNGQPVAKACGVPGFPVAPPYKAPAPDPVATVPAEEPSFDEIDGDDVDGRELDGEPQASDASQAKGPITIVIG